MAFPRIAGCIGIVLAFSWPALCAPSHKERRGAAEVTLEVLKTYKEKVVEFIDPLGKAGKYCREVLLVLKRYEEMPGGIATRREHELIRKNLESAGYNLSDPGLEILDRIFEKESVKELSEDEIKAVNKYLFPLVLGCMNGRMFSDPSEAVRSTCRQMWARRGNLFENYGTAVQQDRLLRESLDGVIASFDAGDAREYPAALQKLYERFPELRSDAQALKVNETFYASRENLEKASDALKQIQALKRAVEQQNLKPEGRYRLGLKVDVEENSSIIQDQQGLESLRGTHVFEAVDADIDNMIEGVLRKSNDIKIRLDDKASPSLDNLTLSRVVALGKVIGNGMEGLTEQERGDLVEANKKFSELASKRMLSRKGYDPSRWVEFNDKLNLIDKRIEKIKSVENLISFISSTVNNMIYDAALMKACREKFRSTTIPVYKLREAQASEDFDKKFSAIKKHRDPELDKLVKTRLEEKIMLIPMAEGSVLKRIFYGKYK